MNSEALYARVEHGHADKLNLLNRRLLLDPELYRTIREPIR